MSSFVARRAAHRAMHGDDVFLKEWQLVTCYVHALCNVCNGLDLLEMRTLTASLDIYFGGNLYGA